MTLAYTHSPASPRWRNRLRSVLQAISAPAPLRIVIYGEHSEDWMSALGPDAPVWARMPQVDEVQVVPDHPAARVPPPRLRGRTVVIPLMETHARNRPRRYASFAPDDRAIRILGDKAAFADYVGKLGLAHLCPRVFARVEDATYPCVLKRVDLNAGWGVTIVRSRRELDTRLAEDMWAGRPFVLQALVAQGRECVTHCVVRNGRVVWHRTFAYEVDEGVSLRTAAATRAAHPATLSPRHLAQIESLLRPLSYSGPCNIDYKLLDTGEIVVFEINPRLGGSLMRPDKVDDLHAALSCLINEAIRG